MNTHEKRFFSFVSSCCYFNIGVWSNRGAIDTKNYGATCTDGYQLRARGLPMSDCNSKPHSDICKQCWREQPNYQVPQTLGKKEPNTR